MSSWLVTRPSSQRQGVRGPTRGCIPRPPRSAANLTGRTKVRAAPVAQGIEHRPPEAGAQVRILPGAPCLTRHDGPKSPSCGESWTHSWIQSRYSASMAGRPSRSRGHIETLPSGSFRAKVYAGIDPLTRKRRYLVETVASESAAKIALTKLQR